MSGEWTDTLGACGTEVTPPDEPEWFFSNVIFAGFGTTAVTAVRTSGFALLFTSSTSVAVYVGGVRGFTCGGNPGLIVATISVPMITARMRPTTRIGQKRIKGRMNAFRAITPLKYFMLDIDW